MIDDLTIFLDKEVSWPCDYVVKYFDEGLEYQKDLPEIDLSMFIVEKSFKIKLIKDICHMPVSDYRFVNVISPIISELFEVRVKNYLEVDRFFEEYGTDVYECIGNNIVNHFITIGGYADFTQSDPRERAISNKEECLFKLDSSANDSEINIGDSGILFALISQDEIKNAKFEETIVDFDCY